MLSRKRLGGTIPSGMRLSVFETSGEFLHKSREECSQVGECRECRVECGEMKEDKMRLGNEDTKGGMTNEENG